MREIVFDTETTGLDLASDRIIEIGCVELINHIPSGETFQIYINPQRSISVDSYRVHGIGESFLADKPVFADAVERFLAFIGDDPLIAHNAEFDLAFVNAELARVDRNALDPARIIDSLALARRRFPAGPNSLDALCSRFGVDASARTVHGALLDSQLLAEVYVELIGGRQANLAFGEIADTATSLAPIRLSVTHRPEPLAPRYGASEEAAHRALRQTLDDGGIWSRYLGAEAPAEPA
jgi:DNA polymerase-3 subunit epsilon